jgi:hypothetical protein
MVCQLAKDLPPTGMVCSHSLRMLRAEKCPLFETAEWKKYTTDELHRSMTYNIQHSTADIFHLDGACDLKVGYSLGTWLRSSHAPAVVSFFLKYSTAFARLFSASTSLGMFFLSLPSKVSQKRWIMQSFPC